jgi:hypothetical protein
MHQQASGNSHLTAKQLSLRRRWGGSTKRRVEIGAGIIKERQRFEVRRPAFHHRRSDISGNGVGLPNLHDIRDVAQVPQRQPVAASISR